MSFEIDFENPLIRRQDISVVVDPGIFKSELSRARTFGLLDDVARLQEAGLARGGSLDNAVVVNGDRVMNGGGLRYEDEFVRHKMLDAFGDLYLAGAPIIGHFRGVRSGHADTRRLLRRCLPTPRPGPIRRSSGMRRPTRRLRTRCRGFSRDPWVIGSPALRLSRGRRHKSTADINRVACGCAMRLSPVCRWLVRRG